MQKQSPTIPGRFLNPIDDFLAEKELERGLSATTIETYRHDLEKVSYYLWKERNVKGWDKAKYEDIVAWLSSTEVKGFSARTLNKMLSAIRGLAKQLVSEKARDESFAKDIHSAKTEKLLPRSLNSGEAEKVVEVYSGSDMYSIRNRAILELFYGAGVRASELCALGKNQINLFERSARVIGKGSKERDVIFGESAKAAIQRYLEIRHRFKKGKDPDTLFLGERGNTISRHQVWRLVVTAAQKAGLEPMKFGGAEKNPLRERIHKVSPHILRHTMATEMLRSHQATLRDIQTLLGHENITTTEIYTKIDESVIKDGHAKYHPRGKLPQPSEKHK